MATTAQQSSVAALLEREQTTVRFTTSVSHGAFHVPGSFERWTTSLVVDPETGDPGDEVVIAQATCARVQAYLPDEWAQVWEQFDEESADHEATAAGLQPHIDDLTDLLGFSSGVIYLERVEVAEELRGRRLGQMVTARLLSTVTCGSEAWVVCAIAGYRHKDGQNPKEEAAIASLLRSLSLSELDNQQRLWAADSASGEFEAKVDQATSRDIYKVLAPPT